MPDLSPIHRIRSLIALVLSWLFVSLYTFVYASFCIFTLRRFSHSTLHIAAHSWGRIPLWLAGIKLEEENTDWFLSAEPRVVVFNHQSMLDIFVLAAIYPPRGVAIIKKEFAFIPIINLALWSVNCIFIDRKNRQKAVNSMNKVAKRLKEENLSLFVAPEGTRSANGTLLPFKKGAFQVAMQGQLPVYPLVIDGAHKLLPKDRVLAKPGTIRVTCLEPVDTSSWNSSNLSTHIQTIRDQMNAKLSNQ